MKSVSRFLTFSLVAASIVVSSLSAAEAFGKRFDAIWDAATPEQRYKLLYD
jgi:hypothetical protein